MELPKTYTPASIEGDIYQLWEQSRVFQPPHKAAKESFSIVMPPPNANGNLHMGHALMAALEDVTVRFQRMQGKAALYVPGADHAGFETWVVYEKQLAKEGKSRFDFSREELYQQVWEFVAQNRGNFERQFRELGVSVDWERFTFTLDEKVVTSSYKLFKKMWEDGLIYRGERLVNYCTFHHTGFADIEVEYKPQTTKLVHIAYPLSDGSGEIVVATTRPETMLGDTAVMVHPKDERYTNMHGKTVLLPLTNREIPIITDEAVDMTFGSGAVKVTPAHDPVDFEVASRHNLPFIHVITTEGVIAHESIPKTYWDLTAIEARKTVMADLEEQGRIKQVEDYDHNVGVCYKCGTVIEPLIRDQWFVKMQPLAEKAIAALEADKITFYPETKRDASIRYLKGIRDWNISRQIPWGIPIPAFQNVDDSADWVFDERVDQEIITIGKKTYRRDPDVFDTWFSSSQWPFVTLGGPGTDDFKQFYPNALMETGGEILYQWVCRMICLGLYVTEDVPFKTVYIHGYVLDEQGRKMSKSLGNVINVPEVLEKYGSDALRMGVLTGRSAGFNQGFSFPKVEAARNFCNKLWNLARYVETKVKPDTTPKADAKSQADHWMLTKLQQLTDGVAADLAAYRYAEAYEKLYHIVWDDFADWYIEASKADTNPELLLYTLATILKVAHPFAPFITEAIWQQLKPEGEGVLAGQEWPSIKAGNEKAAEAFESIKAIVSEIRQITTRLQTNNTTLYHTSVGFIEDNKALLGSLARLRAIEAVDAGKGLHLTSTTYDCWLDIDHDLAKAYSAKLEDQAAAEKASIARLKGRLSNESYVKNAPETLVSETKAQLEQATQRLDKISAEIEQFKTL